MAIVVFAAQPILLQHPSAQWGSPRGTSRGVPSTSCGLAVHRGERSRPMSQPGCVTAALGRHSVAPRGSKTGDRGALLGPVLPVGGGTAPERLPSALQLSDVN